MDGQVIIGTKLDTKSFDKQINEIEGKLEEIELMLSKPKEFNLSKTDISKLNLEAEKLNNKLFDLIKKRDELTGKSNFENISKGLQNVTQKVGKWALAVFSVRSAYMLVRRAVNTLTEDNEQLATDIKFIQYAIAQMLKPAVEFIVRSLYKLIGLINAVYIKLFGTSLFTQEMVNNFNKVNKSANKLKKTLTGFDELNILNDDGSVGVAGNIAMPNLDQATKEMDTWMKKTSQSFYNLGDEIAKALSNPQAFSKAYGVWDKFMYGIVQLAYGLYEPFKGLIDAAAAVGETIYGIFTGDLVLIKDGIVNFVKSIGTTINGIVNIVKGVGTTIAGVLKPIFAGIWNGLTKGAADAWNAIKNIFSTVGTFFKNTFTNAWNSVKNVFSTGGKIFSGITEGITNAFKIIVNKLIDGINAIVSTPFNAINNMLNKIRNVSVLGVKPFAGLWGQNPISAPKIPKLAKGAIANMPGKGIPTPSGSAIWAEAGKEGYLPLTDSQVMSELGREIGKNVKFNADITLELESRVLAKVMKEINNSYSFARNGG